MKGEFLFLGTGASMGIPLIGCRCSVCTSSDSRNKRLRSSGLISYNNKKILLDSGPDFRFQALKNNIHSLDGVIYTHTHYDHIAGIDELRIYYILHGKAVPALLSKESYEDIRQRYSYFFQSSSDNNQKNLVAQISFEILENARGKGKFLGLPYTYVSYSQGGMKVLGYRFGDFAYISDIKEYSTTIFDDLKGVKNLVLSALRSKISGIHFNLEEAIAFSEKIQPESTWITHISHEMEHEQTNAILPRNIQLAYDGLLIPFEVTDG